MCVYDRMFNDFVYGNYTRLNTILSFFFGISLSIYLNAVDMVFYRFKGLINHKIQIKIILRVYNVTQDKIKPSYYNSVFMFIQTKTFSYIF